MTYVVVCQIEFFFLVTFVYPICEHLGTNVCLNLSCVVLTNYFRNVCLKGEEMSGSHEL